MKPSLPQMGRKTRILSVSHWGSTRALVLRTSHSRPVPVTFTVVEHLCYKCQTSIDESLPFCPHCGAPQIRVAPPDKEASPVESGGTPAPPASWMAETPAYLPNAIQWSAAWKGALLAGLVAALLTAMPRVSYGCCLWLLGAGALSVWLYQRRVAGALVTPGMGMRLGALTGVFTFVATALWMVAAFVHDPGEFRGAMTVQLEKSVAANPDPRAQEIIQQFTNNLNTPEGLATFFVMVLVITAIVFVLLTAAGGALGASMFARRRELR